jgi:hypothetical protein
MERRIVKANRRPLFQLIPKLAKSRSSYMRSWRAAPVPMPHCASARSAPPYPSRALSCATKTALRWASPAARPCVVVVVAPGVWTAFAFGVWRLARSPSPQPQPAGRRSQSRSSVLSPQSSVGLRLSRQSSDAMRPASQVGSQVGTRHAIYRLPSAVYMSLL